VCVIMLTFRIMYGSIFRALQIIQKIIMKHKFFLILHSFLTISANYSVSNSPVISVAASPLNKGWFKIQLKIPAPYSLQISGFPHVQFYNFQIFEFPILEFRHSTLEIVGSELYTSTQNPKITNTTLPENIIKSSIIFHQITKLSFHLRSIKCNNKINKELSK
jgi:hypothetical protein